MLHQLAEKIKGGMLKEIAAETRWIYACAAGYKKGILLFMLLGLAGTAVSLASSVVSKYLIDAVIGHKDSLIAGIAALYVGFGLGRIGLSAVTKRISARLSVDASNSIRADVFRRFLDVDWQASLDYHSGDLLSRVNSDVSTVSDSILGWIPSLVTCSVQFLATLAVILAYDPVMALIALVSAPITVLLSRVLLGKMRSFNRQVRERQAELVGFYEESLQNLQAVKSFGLKGRFCSRLEALQLLYRDVSLDYNLFSVKTTSLLSLLSFLVSCLCLLWGVYRLWGGYITMGSMVLFIQLAGMVGSSFSALVGLVPSAIAATVAAGRIMTILDLPVEDESVSPEAGEVLARAHDEGVTVALEEVSFRYRSGAPVFEGFSLRAAPGEIIGVVSPSGGGKTTLVRMLLGLISPDGGSVRLESGGASAPISPCLRPLVSYVAQEKAVFSGTVAQSLRLVREEATDEELEQALRLACAWDFVSALPQGLESRLGERGGGLSEGQVQRLAIARALLGDAPLLLLDEATSALDMATEREVLRNLLSSGYRRTVIVTTHRPTVLAACTRVYAIEDRRARLLSPDEIRDMNYGAVELCP